MGPRNTVLDKGPDPSAEGALSRGTWTSAGHRNVPICMSAFSVIRLPPRANVSAKRERCTNKFAVRHDG